MNGDGNQYGDTKVSDNAQLVQGNIDNFFQTNYIELKETQNDEDWKLLLTSFYYETINDRKNQIHSAHESTCEWIWNTLFARWLRVKNAKIFWISGKPGSGKSTLMKYLSKSTAVQNRLPKQSNAWIIIDFFFDFRLAEQTGNNLGGLLRSLLLQLVEELPGVGKVLHATLGAASRKSLKSPESLEAAFKSALNMTQRCVFLFIDGLDEYTGKLGPLLDFLFRFKNCQNVKVCLASRPEPMIHERLDCLPKISMSNYNSGGIQKYIDAAVVKFQPRLDILRRPDMEKLILQRADGVFLWVHLVMDEVMAACAEGADFAEIKERLEVLPTELELLYHRILGKIPGVRKPSAAIIFTLIDHATRRVTLELLQHALSFISCELNMLQVVKWVDLEHFKKWLHGTMRGLVDLTAGNDERFPNTSTQSLTVRLIHRTLRSYSKTSGWFLHNLPHGLRQIGARWMWAHICSQAILTAERSIDKSVIYTVSCLEGKKLDYNAYIDVITRLTTTETSTHWTVLLFHSITYVPMHAELAASSSNKAVQLLVDEALRCTLACIHYAVAGHHYRGIQPIKKSLTLGINDLMLSAAHRNLRHLKNSEARIRTLNDSQRRELVTMMTMASATRSECPGQCEDSEEDSPVFEKNLVDSILCFDKHVSPFHLAIYLRFGYQGLPQFLYNPIMRGEFCPSSAPEISSWAQAPRLFAREPPLFIWACEYTKSVELTCRAQLQVLAFFGLDINAKCSIGQNIIHYLIARHVIGHTFLERNNPCACYPRDDLAEATEKLYALEEAGANFTEQFEHRTPLQAFRYGVDIVRRAEETAYDIPEARVTHMEFMLEHKEKTGHLPRPMLGRDFWRDMHIPLLLEKKCDICAEAAGVATSSPKSNVQPSEVGPPPPSIPVRPSNSPLARSSRIPRPKARAVWNGAKDA